MDSVVFLKGNDMYVQKHAEELKTPPAQTHEDKLLVYSLEVNS